MHLIEPCCAPKQLLALRSKLGNDGTMLWHGKGDLSLAELLPNMLKRYSQVDVTFVAPTLPDVAARLLDEWMQKQWIADDGKGRIDVIRHLTLIADLRKRKSPLASQWLSENPFGERLTLCNVQQNDTAVLLPDIAFVGNMNLSYNGHFTAMATKNQKVIEDLRKTFKKVAGVAP